MKKIFLTILISYSIQSHSQNQRDTKIANDTNYEVKIAEKTCTYLSKMDSISDGKQAIISSIIKAKRKVHEEDIEKKYTQDWTVEGIRKLNKNVIDLLIRDCKSITITY